MFLKKDILEICHKFTGEHTCRSAISTKLKSNFIEITLRHGFFLYICCIISKHLFLRRSLDGCFCIKGFVKTSMMKLGFFSRTKKEKKRLRAAIFAINAAQKMKFSIKDLSVNVTKSGRNFKEISKRNFRKKFQSFKARCSIWRSSRLQPFFQNWCS